MFKKAQNKLNQRMAMNALRNELYALGAAPNGDKVFDWGIKFFNIIVQFQDAFPKLDAKLFNKKSADNISAINKHIADAGRCKWGWVRAERGTEVTENNLFLGNIYGLFTHPVRVWKYETKDEDAKQKIHNQLRGFVNNHREPMIKHLSEIAHTNNGKSLWEQMGVIKASQVPAQSKVR